jgi:cysteine-rich repeat protein
MKRFSLVAHAALLTALGAFAGCTGEAPTGTSSATTGTTGSGAGGSGGATSGTGGGTSTGTGGSGATGGAGGSGGATTGATGGGGSGGTGGVTTSSTGGGGSGGAGGSPGCVLDGVLTPPEVCDDGNMIEGDGCDTDCTHSCVSPAVDCPAAPPCQQASCVADHTCSLSPDPAQDGLPCGMNALCKAGSCAPISCGDGVIQGAEQCDFGAGNGPGAGCELDCTFSCSEAPDSCSDGETCNGLETCVAFAGPSGMGKKCSPGIQLLDCSACAGGVCGSGMCKASMCGDGCVDLAAGEQCEPPGTVMCSALCKTVVANPCGNGVRDPGEQCDDGNTQNLDGCDASCAFEQDLRSNFLKLQFGVDAFCSGDNRFGSAVSPIAQGAVQDALDQSIAAGTSGFVVKMLGLASPTGADDPSLDLGVMTATPAAGLGYDGANDLDWWYDVTPSSIDVSRNPIDKLPGSILGSVLGAGPGSMRMKAAFFGPDSVLLRMSGVKLSVPIGASFAPTPSVGGAPPGHLPSEHLDPALVSFASAGQKVINFAGKLCGNIAVKSLAQTPIPPGLISGGALVCLEGYTAASSMLDLFVHGCTVNPGGGPLPVLFPTQPDKADPAAPVAGAGAPYTFSLNAQHIVSGCTDKNGVAVSLAACIDAAAYSSYFRFALGRVILH